MADDRRRSADALPEHGFRADGFRADGFRADGFRADGFRTDGFRTDGAVVILVGLLAVGSLARLRAQAPVEPLRFDRGAVVSQSQLASDVGRSVLLAGGNAVDAAVATAFALAVTHPAAGNIGGGGFLVVVRPGSDPGPDGAPGADGLATSFDFRERAPAASTPDMFLDENGRYDADRHHWSHLAVGVPGSVAGLWLAHSKLGRRPWKELVEPAVGLARDGFEISRGLASSLASHRARFARYPASLEQFSIDGRAMRAGERLVQADLARTLERIRDEGPDGFYRGETADLLVREMERGGGRITHADLESYRAVERTPVRGSFHGLDVISMPPPSSGGVALIEMLQILEVYDLATLGPRSAAETHLVVESMRRAYADRAAQLGDPDLVAVPVARLTSKAYAAELRGTIDLERASVSSPESFTWPKESSETTHLSVVDSGRMAVSLTTTLEMSYGAGIVVPGAGFLLNNEMGDFNPREGLTTVEGLIGTTPNLVAPGKRMLSSMTPTILARDGRPVLVLGSPGGRTIINTVLCITLGFVVHGWSAQEAVDAPRLHHQWLPDALVVERGALSPDTRAILERMGHRVLDRKGPQGSAHIIAVTEDGTLEVGVDRRLHDAGAAGH